MSRRARDDLAEDTKLDRKVALKVLSPELAENEERRARFEREAKAVRVGTRELASWKQSWQGLVLEMA